MSRFKKLDRKLGRRPTTLTGWKTVIDAMPRRDRDKYWPGMHTDLIPTFEMVEAEKRAEVAARGPWDSVKSAYTGATGSAKMQQTRASVPGISTPLEGAVAMPYVSIKTDPNGADVSNLSAEILAVYPHIDAVWAMYATVKPVITSGRDSHEDKPASHHNTGNAIDVRANNISDDIAQKIANTLQQRLGSKYFVDFEQPGTPEEDHVHIEYDPH